MTLLSQRAERDLEDLRRHYDAKGRPEAIANLLSAIESVIRRIDNTPSVGLPAPRPYPTLSRPGVRWLKQGAYWVRYAERSEPVILGIYHESADIPRRL